MRSTVPKGWSTWLDYSLFTCLWHVLNTVLIKHGLYSFWLCRSIFIMSQIVLWYGLIAYRLIALRLVATCICWNTAILCRHLIEGRYYNSLACFSLLILQCSLYSFKELDFVCASLLVRNINHFICLNLMPIGVLLNPINRLVEDNNKVCNYAHSYG